MSEQRRISIFVEGPADRVIVSWLLQAAELQVGEIVVCSGKERLRARIHNLSPSKRAASVALIDADELSVFDSRKLAEEQLGRPPIPVFCAVPTIESWLFADEMAATKAARSERAETIVKRLPLPEAIPYPKQVARNVFRGREPSDWVREIGGIDLLRASARSPSLKSFLAGAAEVAGMDIQLAEKSLELSMSTSIGRTALAGLLRELPASTEAWKTLDGTVLRAGDLSLQIEQGTETGKFYVSELLRVARDLIARKARK